MFRMATRANGKSVQQVIYLAVILSVVLSTVECNVQNPSEITYVLCDNGQRIRKWDWCDGEYECKDHSDEKFCKRRPFDVVDHICTDKHFVCDDGMCFPASCRCDGEWDCTNNEDEMNCEYSSTSSTTALEREVYIPTHPTFVRSKKHNQFNIRSITGLLSVERNITQHFLRTRRQETHSINKWGRNAPRIAIALFLNDPGFFALGNKTGEEIAYELSLQLSSKLALRKNIPTKDLALYINALTVACIDPSDFFGVNLVDELRKRVNSNNFTNPFSILTLCNVKDTMTMDDVNKLQQLYEAHFRPVWTDTQAMVVMALSCIHSRSNINLDEKILDEMVFELKRKQHQNGTIDNLKTTALVVQALLATGKYQTDFNLSAALNFIVEEGRRRHPSLHDIFYILPIFNSMSLANISSEHCVTSVNSDLEVISNLHEHLDEHIQVHFSVIIGENTDFSRTWKIKVPSNYTFYQVLENIGTLEPAYRAQYSVSDGKPYVVGLAKFQDDTGDGLFWFTYTKPLASTGSPKLVTQSPADVQVNESEEFILWYRLGFWVNTQENTSR